MLGEVLGLVLEPLEDLAKFWDDNIGIRLRVLNELRGLLLVAVEFVDLRVLDVNKILGGVASCLATA